MTVKEEENELTEDITIYQQPITKKVKEEIEETLLHWIIYQILPKNEAESVKDKKFTPIQKQPFFLVFLIYD